jgi:hypothetical protein
MIGIRSSPSPDRTKYPASSYADESDPGPYAVFQRTVSKAAAPTGDRHAIAVDTDNCILIVVCAFPESVD